MNYMFNFAINIHNYSVILFLIMILVNLFLLSRAKDLFKFRKQMAFTTPLTAVFLTSTLFTGIVIVLAKHLRFDVSNILMIIIGLIVIFLEIKRIKPLKYLKNVSHALPLYREYAQKFLLIEFIFVFVISIWMWI